LPNDELDDLHIQVTRLNDKRIGARANLLDAIQSPAAGDAERENARKKRSNRMWGGLLSTIQKQQEREDVSLALITFEEEESKRKHDLQQSMMDFREREWMKLEKKSTPSSSSWWSFSTVTSWFRTDKNASIKKLFARQLQNESKLFRDLKKAEIDSETIERILSQASTTCLSTSSSSSEKKKSCVSSKEEEEKDDNDDKSNKIVYVLDFKGDIRASKGGDLSEEISAILSLPTKPSEIILRLMSAGGTVTGYGKCGAELDRIRRAGVTLTVCVDEMAASGGYMMACVAHKVYVAPFAAVGSIGVIVSSPNVAARLKTEGVSVIQQTAGKYKRTVTPWKEPETEELVKLQDDVDTIQKHFVSHVAKYRGDRIKNVATEVATGEVWYGTDALEKGLVDEIMVSEEYIQQKMDDGYELIHIQKASYSRRMMGLASLLGGASSIVEGGNHLLPGLTTTTTSPITNMPTPMLLHDAIMDESYNVDTHTLGGGNTPISSQEVAQAVQYLSSKQKRDLITTMSMLFTSRG